MLHHGCDRDRCHNKNGCQVKLAKLERRQTDYRICCCLREIQDSGAICICHTCKVHDQRYNIRDHNTHQDRDDLEHTLAPDIEDNDDAKSDQCQ